MNKLCRTFAAVLSSPSTQKWPLSIFILQSQLHSATSLTKRRDTPNSKLEPPDSEPENLEFPVAEFPKKEISDWPRPSEIPFQVKVANSVSLIGSVAMPIQFESSPNGKSWAGTIITQERTTGFPAMWIPVLFEGDLAHVAVCHLKENDLVHIAGQLSADTPPFTVEKGQANVQVMVQSVSFVQDSYKRNAPHKHDIVGLSPGIMKDNISVEQYWNQLLAKPHEWMDKRLSKNNQTHAFEHKGSGKLLWIDESTPKWILSKLDSMTFACESEEKSQKSGVESADRYWIDLVNYPERWRDYRKDKMDGKVKQGHPDFKCKEDGHALWFNSAPISLLPKLKGISETNFGNDSKSNPLTNFKKEESWKNLVENPDKWWDNRLSKRNEKAPDFKNKDTGEGLWVNSSPTWVLPKLPPLKANNDFAVSKGDSLLS
ncbi:hypothetical protein NE237_025589 [Protea cynaroides]|uniref:Uncharacterized protein n=1 Tax=Protea cynaroides TaxID=273540 RepID=A0A9Q0H566_9MAGN|nr:hypothetical protein NE237_025589 [Protea cynaroides]